MSEKSAQLWTRLLESGLVSGSAPETVTTESPWYVKTLLGFSGWLAALFLLGFISIGFQFIMDSAIASTIIGIIMIGSAYLILRLPKNEFVEHLALAISLAGQILILVAIFEFQSNDSILVNWILVALLQIVLTLLMPNFVHRVFSSFFSSFALSMALYSITINYIFSSVVMLLVAYLWLNEFKYPQHTRKFQAIAYGLVLSLFQIQYSTMIGKMFFSWQARNSDAVIWLQPWMGEVLSGAVLLYVVWVLLQRSGQAISTRISITALAGSLLIALLSIEATGITIGVVIILLGYSASNRVLSGLGIVSLLYFISAYYYSLNTTLLQKSLTLLLVGIALLACRWFLMHVLLNNRSEMHE